MHLGEFHGAVVHKDYGVRQNVPFLQNLPNGFRLPVPVRLDGIHTPLREKQVVSLEGRRRQFGIILAGDSDQSSRTGQRCEKLLIETVQLCMFFQMPLDAVHALLSQNSRPERVIQIRDQTFLRLRADNQFCHQFSDDRCMGGFIWKPLQDLRPEIESPREW